MKHHDNKIIKYKNKTFQIIDQFGYDDYFIFLQFVIYRRRTDKPPAPPASSVEKSEYYVSTTGNDENPGTLTSPWRTIQKAVTTVTPGCVVNIMGGTYYEEIKVTVSGTN